ncbi:uncharacterized protein J4E84_009663 [Alternaria hordeiaustralica]|uniref:uncharacterized protein n=1 Tax=Alternaria hordeiaustralica TaxID=1187925 RepID=UPI0020C50060|nr:uncharacterized protein J4E84_009663 [Alternaria hordeiaustralica]KAI4676047.1 hypothetical protein J4E84_009663 [Alternaria hordeiaustralica]
MSPGSTTLLDLERGIKNKQFSLALYEQAAARLGDTAGEEWKSFLNTVILGLKTSLQALEAQYTSITARQHTQRLHEDPHVPTISIAELTRVVSEEADARDDLLANMRTLERIGKKRNGFEQELQEKLQSMKRRLQLRSYASRDAAMDMQDIEDIQEDILHYKKRIQSITSDYEHLVTRVCDTMMAANRAAKSHLTVPGLGRWAPVHAPVAVTITPDPASNTVSTATAQTAVTVTAAQVRVSDIHSQVEASAGGVQMGTVSGAVTSRPRTKTAIVKLDERLSSLTLSPRLEQYADVKPVHQQQFNLGDIGWFPVLRPSWSSSSKDIHTEFGYICAKSYPLIIVEKLDDCMLGLIISTSHGNGLRLKGDSVRDRSVPVVDQFPVFAVEEGWGSDLFPRQTVRVANLGGEFHPLAGSYVDMLNAVMVPYDSRFQKKGSVMKDDVITLQRMRLSAVLTNSQAGALMKNNRFWNYMTGWEKHVANTEHMCRRRDDILTEMVSREQTQ